MGSLAISVLPSSLVAKRAPCDLSRNYILSYPGGPREGVSGCLIFLGVGASFRHEKRKIATRPFALGSNRMRLTFDDCVLDVARRELRRGSELIAVEPQVFDLLVYLAQNPDRVVTKNELLQAVWDGRVVSESAINNRVNAARRAIGDSGEAQRLILTVPRKGFRFIGAIKELGAESAKAAVPPDSPRPRGIPPAFLVAAASALLSAALTTFLLWPGAGPLSRLAVGMLPARTPMPASGGDLRVPIAVLPFAAHSSSAEEANLAASLTEGLTTELSRERVFLVTLRNLRSVDLDQAIDATQTGRRPAVRYILDGSVEQAGGEIRVTAEVVDVKTGAHLWADHYDRPIGNRLDWEDEIAGRIVNAVGDALVFQEADRPGEGADPTYLIRRGRALLRIAASRKTFVEAVEVLERALEIAPGSVPAKILLANALAISTAGAFQINGAERLRRAEHLVDAALAAAPKNPSAHYSKAQVLRLQRHCELLSANMRWQSRSTAMRRTPMTCLAPASLLPARSAT